MSSDYEPLAVTPHKTDPAWKHADLFKSGERIVLKCMYCGKVFKGGGIHRFKEHLAGQKGNASVCPRVLPDVRAIMVDSLSKVVPRKTRKHKQAGEITLVSQRSHEMEAADVDHSEVGTDQLDAVSPNAGEPNGALVVNEQEIVPVSTRVVQKRKRGRPKKNPEPEFHAPITVVSPGGIRSDFVDSKSFSRELHMAIGRFLYDVGLPLEAVNSAYFQPMVDVIGSYGKGVVGPTVDDLRGWVLRDAVEEVKANIDESKRSWARTGCSVLVEELTTEKGRKLVNFLVHSTEGTMFLKSMDTTDFMDSSDSLYDLIKEVVVEVGVENVLQVITHGDERYIGASKRLFETFPTLYWAPCAASAISMMLEDIGKLESVSPILDQSKSMTRFIYNNSVVLNMMKKHTFGVDVVVPGETSSVTDFKTLKRILEVKHNLRILVTSQEWVNSFHSKKEGGLAMLDSMTDDKFWSLCSLIVRLTDPLLRIFEILRCEKRPAMGYIYAALYRAKEMMKKELGKREDYRIYWNIIDHRWGKNNHTPLHCAGFFLNPRFYYSIEGDVHGEIMSGVLDCIERLVPDTTIQDKIMKELNAYKNASGDFGRKMAIRARDTMLPDEWWSTYGGSCPNLARLAIRILSQRCSLIQCKTDPIPFEQIYGTKNSLEHQRLNDLVFTQYNLRLRQMSQRKTDDSPDPIAFTFASGVQDWVSGEGLSSEDQWSTNWKALELPVLNPPFPKSSTDEFEPLSGGFDDYEIFAGFNGREEGG